MSTIKLELEKALDTKKGKKEEYDEYLERLVDDAGADLSDDEFDGLSKETQKWLNKGTSALDKNKPVADFPDVEEEEEEEEKSSKKKGKSKGKKAKKEVEPEDAPEDDDEEEEAPKKSAKKGKKAAPKKEKTEKKDKKPSAISRMQFFCCKHPKWDKARVGEKVEKEGYEFSPATLSIQYGATHKIMAIIASLSE